MSKKLPPGPQKVSQGRFVVRYIEPENLVVLKISGENFMRGVAFLLIRTLDETLFRISPAEQRTR